eukprot:CAMPEP_0170535088 /NCGR_PEP_ID=MMETSP0209-20121228/97549_1 /TAXON_ID=665100 ORGANISM="Litonotus pictus, Strain P1" /NCGR_SAMPLE_ID=MMETSP0209 /ASSEMBLY_ACC=CAM_ASM_000301 /LENGTH=259 /DNA_ID=CAMNT_0010835557 /DNA_START=20 /DNA_END=799 /DNA_ORIENTATION=+
MTNVMQPSVFGLIEKTISPFINSSSNISDLSVLDLACGEGQYTRCFRKHCSQIQVIGADLAEDMIKQATLQETKLSKSDKDYKQIEYLTLDCLEGLEELNIKFNSPRFDIVSAFYLLNYSANEEILLEGIKKIGSFLNKDGVFVGVINALSGYLPTLETFGKYGIASFNTDKNINREKYNNGELARFIMFEPNNYKPEGPFFFDMTATRYYTEEVMTKAFTGAGFEVTYHPMTAKEKPEEFVEACKRTGTIFVAKKVEK